MQDQGGAIDWDDFRFVLAIVRGGSVSAAAKQLGVDHATVIRRVDRLERHLNAKLFDRRKTGYLLTEAGQRVADSAEAMESTIVANQEAVGGSRAHLTGTVRIGAPDGFGSHFLASRLGETVRINRHTRVQTERRDRLLMHLFQHQIHHRGQAHGMLAGTAVEPPQLDEFFAVDEAPLRAKEFSELGWTEQTVWKR